MPRQPKTERTWLLTVRGGTQRLFEVTLPLDEAPDWEPPTDGGGFAMEHLAPLELYLDGKLAATGANWAEVLAAAARKLSRRK